MHNKTHMENKISTMIKMKLWMYVACLICGTSLFTACSDDDDIITTPSDEIEAQLQKMTLREKVGQMFYVRPESLDPTAAGQDYTELKLQEVNNNMRTVNALYPVGGIILYAHNINDEPQLMHFTSQLHQLKGQPLLCIDEEGGRVVRIANNTNFNIENVGKMGDIGETGDPERAYTAANTIGTYLKKYGFDVDFAPVADVNTNPENVVIGLRAFSDEPYVAAPMVVSYLQGLKDAGVIGCIKHFPGHGDTKADTHYGYAQSQKTWEEIRNCEMITFRAGINWGCQLIMTAHISVPNVTGTDIPATLSSIILQDKLREEMGYENVIIADAMEMGAITKQYEDNTEAVKLGIKAGLDIILNPMDFRKAFDAVVKAVYTGEISEERINESVRRILRMKRSIKDAIDDTDPTPLKEWTAGATVSKQAIEIYGGIDKCFAAEPIPDDVWERMQGKTYKENPYIQRDDLRHIRTLHWDYDHKIHIGEMVVNKQIADVVVNIFRQLYDAKYPIQRMVLPDVYNADDEMQMRDNNTSSFCYRTISGSGTLSKHARGLAIDVNTLYNPYYKDRESGRYVQPATATKFCDRTWNFPYKIDEQDLCYQLFTEAGFEWGGSWTSCKDYQHFEYIEKE